VHHSPGLYLRLQWVHPACAGRRGTVKTYQVFFKVALQNLFCGLHVGLSNSRFNEIVALLEIGRHLAPIERNCKSDCWKKSCL